MAIGGLIATMLKFRFYLPLADMRCLFPMLWYKHGLLPLLTAGRRPGRFFKYGKRFMSIRRLPGLSKLTAILIIAGTIFTATGCTTLSVRGQQLMRAAVGYEPPSHPVGSPEFGKEVAGLTRTCAWPDTSVKLLQNGDEVYPVMLQLIASAKKRISLTTYIVGKDAITDRFFEALKEAAKRGVEVRLLVDAAGYDRGMIVNLGNMNGENLQARVFNPFFLSWTIIRGNNRNHRKVLVVDGHYAVMGGMNLAEVQEGNGISGWRDTSLLVAGPVATAAERIFAETWEQAGRGWFGKTLPVTILNPFKLALDQPFLLLGEAGFGQKRFTPPDYAPPDTPDVFPADFYDTNQAGVRAVGSSPDTWSSPTHDVTVAGILGARERIDAAYAYFVPPRAIRRALVAAARRGVRVRLLLPKVADVKFVREIGMKRYGELLEAGVEIYEWPHPILHAKTMAVDGEWLMVGSANMDCRSYFLNYEALFAVEDANAAAAAHRQFERDLAETERLSLETWQKRGLKQRFLETLLTPLAGQY